MTQPITTRFLTWAECFTTTAETPVNTRFVNADGKSIMDLLAEEGSNIVAFYREKGDIHAFLEKRGAKLDDFKWDSPFGVLSISEALAKINAGEIKIPIGGRRQLWSLERMLCFKGNTYAELFVSTGTIMYERMRQMSNKISVKKLTLAIGVATFGFGYGAYYASVGLGVLFKKRDVGNDSASHSELVIDHSLKVGLPLWRDEFSSRMGGGDARSVSKAEGVANQYLRNYGQGMVGNHWPVIEQKILGIEASQGRSGITDFAITNFFGLIKNGLPLNPQSCSEIERNPSITRLGEPYSIALYAGALDEQTAVDALAAMVDGWRKTGKINLPVRSQMLSGIQPYQLNGALNHVGSMTDNGSYSACAISPIVGVALQERPADPNNYILVSMLVRTPMANGSAGVSMRLFAFANDVNGKAYRVFQVASAGQLASMDKLVAERIAEYENKPVEGFEEYKAFLDITPDYPMVAVTDFSEWKEEGEFPATIPVVSLEEFIAHRNDENTALPVVAYKLDSAVTKYMVSAISKEHSAIKRSLLAVYDTGEDRGAVGLNCKSCNNGIEGFEFYDTVKLAKTAEDFREDLVKTEFGNPDVSVDDELKVIYDWLVRRGFVKDSEGFKQKASLVEDRLIEMAVIDRLRNTGNKISLINTELLVKELISAGVIQSDADLVLIKSKLSKAIATTIAGSHYDYLDAITKTIGGAVFGTDAAVADADLKKIKSAAINMLVSQIGFEKPGLLDLLSDGLEPDGEYTKLVHKYAIADFASFGKSIDPAIEGIFNTARKEDKVLGRVLYKDFKTAVCDSFGVSATDCDTVFTKMTKKDFLKD